MKINMINQLVLEELDEDKKKKLKKLAIAGGLAALGGHIVTTRRASKKLEKSRNRKILGLTAAGVTTLGIAKSAENGALNTLYHLHQAKKQYSTSLNKIKEMRGKRKILKHILTKPGISPELKQMKRTQMRNTGTEIAHRQLEAKAHINHIQNNNKGFLNNLLKSKVDKMKSHIDSHTTPLAKQQMEMFRV